jgi:SAM-dependent methyltransferase
VTAENRWLAAVWPFVHDNLPAPPARVIEIGCGPLGGFVPELRALGYRATGIDPEAPEGPEYLRMEFESYQPGEDVDVIVACTSLHHVADLAEVLQKASAMLAPTGALVVVEWAMERFDDATAQWCFDRLGPQSDEHSWLHERQAQWEAHRRASGGSWDSYRRDWAEHERLHAGADVVRELDTVFDRQLLEFGPFLFPDLDGVTEQEEQSAIDAGLIQAMRVQYVGTPR